MQRRQPSRLKRRLRVAKRKLQRLHRQTSGASTLEWVLLLAAIGLPAYWIISMALAALTGHYHMITTLIHMPFP